MAFLQDLLDATKESESPDSFLYWSGLCAISAVMRKNVYLDKQYYRLYPNVYVMLVAKPGGRKGFPIDIARTLVELVGCTRVIYGRNTIQALIKELSLAYTKPDGTVVDKAHVFLPSEEFINLIVNEPGSLAIMTTLYDTWSHRNGWKNTLKGAGIETLKEPCVTMMSASNPTYFKERISATDINGGFVGRTLIIQDDSRNKINPLTRAPKIRFVLEDFVPYLKELMTVGGPFEYTKDGMEFYEEWYGGYRARTRTMDDETGSADRFHDNVLKVAMLLSLSENKDLKLTPDYIKQAISLCTMSVSNIKKLATTVGKGSLSAASKIFVDKLLSVDGNYMMRKDMLKQCYAHMDVFELDKIVETLQQAGAIQIIQAGKEIVYRMTPEFVGQFNDFLKEEPEGTVKIIGEVDAKKAAG